MKTILGILHILVSCSTIIQSQHVDTTSIYSLIESYLEDATSENSNEQIYDLVEQLLAEPIDINKASAEDLLTIPFIDITSASKIIAYRNNSGRIFSLEELNMISEVPIKTINILKAFVYVNRDSVTPKSVTYPARGKYRTLNLSLRSRIIKDIQERRWFIENRYSGSNIKSYNRLQLNYNSFRIGLLAEKDAGEKSYHDFLSYHLEIKDLGIIDRIVLGDYLFEFWQGLAVWGPYSFSKGSDATGPVIKKNRNIISYSSTDENKFFRSIAAGITLGPVGLAAFYSSKNLDASIDTETDEITSLVNTRFHRTESEVLKNSSVSEKVYGAMVNISLFERSAVNLLYLNSEFSHPHRATSFRDLSGSRFNFFSISYSTSIDSLYVSGEFAFDGENAAIINNLKYSIHRRVTLLASVRSYDKSYNSLYSNGFSESSNVQNEYGIYLRIKWNSNFGLINIYYDQFKFPSATFTNPLPGVGNEILFNYNNKLSKKNDLALRYKIENKEITSESEGLKLQINRQKQSARIDFKMNLNKRVKFRTRLEYIFIKYAVQENQESGFLTFQDVQYKPYNNLTVYSRIIFFQTDSFNSRIYEFENDLRGVMTNIPLFGKGMKWYLVVKYSFLNIFTLSLKYSELFEPEENYLGSGLSEINGNIDNRISFQLDLKY